MCEAGVRYYDKILKKNIAIRELSGKELYSASGNINYFLRYRSMPLTARKQFFETELENYRKQKEQNTKEQTDEKNEVKEEQK